MKTEQDSGALELLEREVRREREARLKAERLLDRKTKELLVHKVQADAKLKLETRLRAEAVLFLSIARIFQMNGHEEAIFRHFIRSVCQMTSWPIGHLYVCDPNDPSFLVSSKIFHFTDEKEFRNFKEITEKTKFAVGVGLPGMVYESGKSQWIENVMECENFPRRLKFTKPLGAGFALPIRRFGQIIAVAEFFSTEVLPFNKRMVDVVEASAHQLNSLMDHLGVERRLRQNYSELEQTIRSLKQAQAQLVQSEKMASLGTLAAGVAHEINNPMAFILSNLEVLQDYSSLFLGEIESYDQLRAACLNGESRESLRKLAEKLEDGRGSSDVDYVKSDVLKLVEQSLEGAHRVKDIVKNLKDFARIDQAEFQVTDINEGIRATLKIAWNELKYKCEVIEDLGDIPQISCLPQELNQVFLNLLVNAAQAIQEKGQVKVRSCLEGDFILVSVSDTGSGIAPENIHRIFDPFYTTKPIGKGTGLGLSIAHDIIKKHGGMIDVESQLGKGTTFTIRLPIRASDERREDHGDDSVEIQNSAG